MKKEIVSKNTESTIGLGKELGRFIQAGMIFGLVGDLGGGKTTFLKGVAEYFGIKNITSPTFVIMRKYPIRSGGKNAPKTLYHFDMYRVGDEKEALEAGLSDALADKNGVIFIEWADRIEEALPKEMAKIEFDYLGPEKRKIVFSSLDKKYEKVIKEL